MRRRRRSKLKPALMSGLRLLLLLLLATQNLQLAQALYALHAAALSLSPQLLPALLLKLALITLNALALWWANPRAAKVVA